MGYVALSSVDVHTRQCLKIIFAKVLLWGLVVIYKYLCPQVIVESLATVEPYVTCRLV
jgi:hypothetical protein